jgi:hypothetical protein
MNTTTQLNINIIYYIIQPLKHIKMNKSIEQIYQIESHGKEMYLGFSTFLYYIHHCCAYSSI